VNWIQSYQSQLWFSAHPIALIVLLPAHVVVLVQLIDYWFPLKWDRLHRLQVGCVTGNKSLNKSVFMNIDIIYYQSSAPLSYWDWPACAQGWTHALKVTTAVLLILGSYLLKIRALPILLELCSVIRGHPIWHLTQLACIGKQVLQLFCPSNFKIPTHLSVMLRQPIIIFLRKHPHM